MTPKQQLLMTIAADCLARSHPYKDIGDYMDRKWLLEPGEHAQGIGMRCHTINRSDRDPHMHDHPWWSISIILENSYIEQMPNRQEQDPRCDKHLYQAMVRKPGDIVFRQATDRHRIIVQGDPVKTLFIMGPRENDWGFYLPDGKVGFREYLNGKRPTEAD